VVVAVGARERGSFPAAAARELRPVTVTVLPVPDERGVERCGAGGAAHHVGADDAGQRAAAVALVVPSYGLLLAVTARERPSA